MPVDPNDPVLPWEWNLPVEAYMWAVIIVIVLVVYLAASQGRDRKGLPNDLGRHVEDFAGVTQEANGPLTNFLVLFYVAVALGMIGYIAITLTSGYRY